MGSGPEQEEARARLTGDREAARRHLGELERELAGIMDAARSVSVDDEHDPEGATIAFEREHAAALARQARRHLADIDAALGRLARGQYGRCVHCGGPVSPARLAARPAAAACITCASRPA